MDIVTLIAMPVSGAVIGYCTNWIAIKMLFRPYGEKRLFGMRLPFTPGLIPKGRHLIGQKIGRSVSESVLTKEVLTNSISSPEIMAKLENAISGALERLCAEEISVKNAIAYFSPEGNFPAKQLEDAISGVFLSLLENNELRNKLSEYLHEKAKEIRASSGELLHNALSGNQKTAAELFGSDASVNLAEFISAKLPYVASLLTGFEENNPELSRKLRGLIAKTAKDNFGSLVGIFVHYDKLYDKLIKGAAEYLCDEENRLLIRHKLSGLLLKYSEMSIAELSASLSENLGSSIQRHVSEELIENSLSFLNGRLNELIENDAKAISQNAARWIVRHVSSINISGFLRGLGDERKSRLTRFTLEALMRLITSGGGYIVQNIDIGKIMADKFDEFEMHEIEDLVLSVVKRELNGITNMGGVLGFVIGLLPLIMELF